MDKQCNHDNYSFISKVTETKQFVRNGSKAQAFITESVPAKDVTFICLDCSFMAALSREELQKDDWRNTYIKPFAEKYQRDFRYEE